MLATQARRLIGQTVYARPNYGAGFVGTLLSVEPDRGRSWCVLRVARLITWVPVQSRPKWPPREGEVVRVGIANVKALTAEGRVRPLYGIGVYDKDGQDVFEFDVPASYAESARIALGRALGHARAQAASDYFAKRAPQLAEEAKRRVAMFEEQERGLEAWLKEGSA